MENENSSNNNANANANAKANANAGSIISRETIDSVASWVSATISSAFFSSLDRFSCVNVGTVEFGEDDDDEAADRPLALTKLAHPDQQQQPNDVAQLPV